MDFLCLHLGGIHYTKNLKINLTELYPSIHAEIKLLHFLIKEGRHAEKKNKLKYKPTIPAFAPAWCLPKQRWSRRTLQL